MALDVRRGGVTLTGLDELDRNLRKLEVSARGKALRSALMFASTPMFQKAKANAAAIKDSGALFAAMGRWSRIGKRALPGRPDGRGVTDRKAVSTFIGPRMKNRKALALWNAAHPQRRPLTAIPHGHLAEFGSEGFAGHRYMTRAFDAHKFSAVGRFRTSLRKQIDKVRSVGRR